VTHISHDMNRTRFVTPSLQRMYLSTQISDFVCVFLLQSYWYYVLHNKDVEQF